MVPGQNPKQPCTRCAASTEHTREDCPHKDKEHLAIVCTGTSIDQVMCSCCGDKGHRKAECPKNHPECRVCYKTGRFQKQSASTRSKVAKPTARARAKARYMGSTTSPWQDIRNAVWRCPKLSCYAFHYQDDAKCRVCKAARLKTPSAKEDAEEQPPKEMLMMKAGAKVIGRLSNIDQAAEELLSPKPKAEVETAQMYQELTDLIHTLAQQGKTEWAEATEKERNCPRLL